MRKEKKASKNLELKVRQVRNKVHAFVKDRWKSAGKRRTEIKKSDTANKKKHTQVDRFDLLFLCS